MADSSISSSIKSFSEPFTKEEEMALYQSINMNLQAIQKATHDINLKYKIIQEDMCVTIALIDAIETKAPAVNQD